MKSTRFIVGITIWILAMGPFLMLGKLSYDIRGYGLLMLFRNADMELPWVASLVWPFGPISWWSFLTPVALAVAVAAALRKPLPVGWLCGLLAGSLIQATALFGSIQIYYKMTSVMGYPVSVPQPMANIGANLSLLGASLGLAAWSVAKAMKRR